MPQEGVFTAEQFTRLRSRAEAPPAPTPPPGAPPSVAASPLPPPSASRGALARDPAAPGKGDPARQRLRAGYGDREGTLAQLRRVFPNAGAAGASISQRERAEERRERGERERERAREREGEREEGREGERQGYSSEEARPYARRGQ